MNDTAAVPNPHNPLASDLLEHLHQAARGAASWDILHRPASAGTFPTRVRAAQNALKKVERELATPRSRDTASGEMQPASHSSALGDLRENFRLLRSAINGVADSPRVVARLPRVLLHGNQDEPRAIASAGTYLRAVDGDFSAPTFRAF